MNIKRIGSLNFAGQHRRGDAVLVVPLLGAVGGLRRLADAERSGARRDEAEKFALPSCSFK